MKKCILYILTVLFCSHVLAGETKRGEFGFMFLNITPDARSYSLGNTVAIGNQWNSGYWNPAGIGFAKDMGFQYDHIDFFHGMSGRNLTTGYSHKKWGSIAVSYFKFSYGSIEKTSEEFPDGGIERYEPYEDVLAVSYAYTFFDKISCGATVKRVHSEIDKISASGVLFDIGVMGKLPVAQIASTTHTFYAGLSAGNNLFFGKKPRYEGNGLTTLTDIGTDTLFLSYGREPFNVMRNYRAGVGYGVDYKDKNILQGNVKIIEWIGHFSYQDFSSTNIFISDHSFKSNQEGLVLGTEFNFFEIASVRFTSRNYLKDKGYQKDERFGYSIQIPFKFFVKSKYEVTPKYEYSEQDNPVDSERITRWSFGIDLKL